MCERRGGHVGVVLPDADGDGRQIRRMRPTPVKGSTEATVRSDTEAATAGILDQAELFGMYKLQASQAARSRC